MGTTAPACRGRRDASATKGPGALLAERPDELLQAKGALSEAPACVPEADTVPWWAQEFPERERGAVAVPSYEEQAARP